MSRFRLLACAALMAFGAVSVAAPVAEAQSRPGHGVAAEPVQRAVSFAPAIGAAEGTLVLPLSAEGDLATRGAALSEADRAAVLRAVASAEFSYGARSTLSLRGIGPWDRIFLIGLGSDADALGYQNAGAVTGRALVGENGPLTIVTTGLSAEAVAEFATGLGIGEYRSDLYDTDANRDPLGAMRIVTDAGEAQALYARRGRHLIDAMAFARDLSNEPANVVYPESFVARTREAFRGVPGVSITVLDVPAMERLGMGAILGVGRGSERPPRMLIVRYRGRGAPEGGPIVLAGKGITYDSGGLSIKTADGMLSMKMDMSGAASVTAAVLALARSEASVDVVAISALAENMPDGAAIRPGDVLTAMNGLTIEVTNTDAEGRLVLADALSWAEANLDPAAIVDVATLTGSMNAAVGDDYAGLFSRHDALADQLVTAGEATGELLWRLPLHASYAESMRSPIADIKNNTADGGAGGGTGAYFIGRFAQPETPWAHLDIASVAWGAANDWKPAGSAGFSVRLLERFVRDWRPVERVAGDAD
jgi:leucyl aminopeptidase